MKISPSDVKKGVILDVEGKLFKVIDTAHTHTWRGGATYTFKSKDIINGSNLNLTYKSTTILEQAEVQTNSAIFLYQWGDNYTFMENDTSEMHELSTEDLDGVLEYMKENLDCFLMIHEGNVIGVILPNTIEYTIESTVPAIKWNRANSGKKPATLDNGLEVMVPLHMSEGSTVRVNTLTGEAG